MMKFSDFLIFWFFFRNDIVWNKIYKSIKIQFPIALKNANIKRTFSGKCVFQILSIFYKLTVLWVSVILFLKYSMCIVWVGKLWKKPNFLFQKNLFLNQFSKELQCVRNQQKAFFLKSYLSYQGIYELCIIALKNENSNRLIILQCIK